jgi:hypothetical protein
MVQISMKRLAPVVALSNAAAFNESPSLKMNSGEIVVVVVAGWQHLSMSTSLVHFSPAQAS